MFRSQISNIKYQIFTGFLLTTIAFAAAGFAQTETPPAPSAPRSVKIPDVLEKKLPNGLTVATAERKNVPLVTIHLSVNSGAGREETARAGLANLTASMLTKGTKTRTATQIAEQVEFLGGAIITGAGWNNSVVAITVTSDKLDAALTILSDVVLNPKFDQKELDLLKSQTLDGLAYNLKQPGFLANFVASKYAFNEHPAGGTPETVEKISVRDIARFKNENYTPENSVLIFAGDITSARANALAQKFFGNWRNTNKKIVTTEAIQANAQVNPASNDQPKESPLLRRILVVDLPNSGQASVNFAAFISEGRGHKSATGDKTTTSDIFYPALVLNSALGGGYSSRLNQEIRIKRGLSYGAGSNFAWRFSKANFSTSTQTKNESAPEVAELVLAEIKKMSETDISRTELAPRKLVLTGDFGRELETTATLAQTIAALYTYDLPLTELKTHIGSVNSVSEAQIKDFAGKNLRGGDIVIVGDYKVFKDDLAKRFPNVPVEVVRADALDISAANLQKAK